VIFDWETQELIVCPNDAEHELSIVTFVFGSRVDCDICGITVTQ
jgi:hypothetical protein